MKTFITIIVCFGIGFALAFTDEQIIMMVGLVWQGAVDSLRSYPQIIWAIPFIVAYYLAMYLVNSGYRSTRS